MRTHLIRNKRTYITTSSGCIASMLVLVGVFFITKGTTPHMSELMFVEYSENAKGAIIPASCESPFFAEHDTGDCAIPTINSVAVSSSYVVTDGATQYSITITGEDSRSPDVMTYMYALINYQGANAGNYRGYLLWNAYNPYTGYKDPRNCSGIGYGAIYHAGYGPSYLTLDACTVTDSGNTRTVTFTVRFDSSFTTPSTNNDISGIIQTSYGADTGWINFDLDFGRGQKLTAEVLGTGAIASTPAGFACSAGICTQTYLINTPLTLTATAGSGATFSGWSGACSGTGTCAVTMDAAKSVTAEFVTPASYTLTTTASGTGSVTPSPAGTTCSGDCADQVVSTFASGIVSGPSALIRDSSGNFYTANSYSSNVYKILSTGSVGTTYAVGSGPEALAFDSSGNLYSANYNANTVSKITPAGAVSWFANVNGPAALAFDSSGNLYVASYSGNAVRKITPAGTNTLFSSTGALPTALAFDSSGNLYVAHSGGSSIGKITPAGTYSLFATVGSSPRALTFDSSGNLYTANFSANTVSKITPAGAVSTFATVGSNPRALVFDSSSNLYSANSFSNTISKITPPDLECEGMCNTAYPDGTVVVLTATPTGSTTFAGWSGGGCSGTGTCSVTMTSAKSVTASFVPDTQTLTVSKSGTRIGTVTGSPAGINCGDTCSYEYSDGAVVTLTALAADASSTFTGWSGGGCSGTSTCVVTMSSAQNVSAGFSIIPTSTTAPIPEVPYNTNPAITLTTNKPASEAWYYCYVRVDGVDLPGTPGYFSEGTFYPGNMTTPGAHTATSHCTNSSGIDSGWTAVVFTVAPEPIAGVCGLTLNTCSIGTFSDIADSGTESLWECLGVDGGATSSCALARTALSGSNLILASGNPVEGNELIFSGDVMNYGSVASESTFSTDFSYQWDGTGGAWTPLSTTPHAIINAGVTRTDLSAGYTPSDTGTLYIQYCVDSALEVTESDEGDNCTIEAFDIMGGSIGKVSVGTLSGGETDTIYWSTENASDCTVTGGADSWTGTSNLGIVTSALYGDTTYTLACEDVNNVSIPIQFVTVDVDVTPEITLTSRLVEKGTPVTIMWDTHNNNEQACTLTGGDITDPLTANEGDFSTGSIEITITAKTTYTLSCPDPIIPGNWLTSTMTVEILPRVYES